ncbi:pterocarpan synthase 1-like [Eucalyptus grandis]|uniref:pterocarpan synthase 1-like n=1 Tax=Eucalyptus grandis TaxID=71139 RepID=UPI00192EDA95|nr:pterocarpan synthase 1-like [Eucalyptus grandis]
MVFLSIFIWFPSSVNVSFASSSFSRSLLPEELGLKKQKLSHLHFYFHDIVSGRNSTAVRVAKAKMTDPLNEGPELSSKIVDLARGLYASSSLSEIGLLMVKNYFFTEGKYNGSTLSVLGGNAVFSGVREMPIVGGRRLFRFARGYARARTHSLDLQTGDAVVEYNVYVFHY